MNTGKTVPSGSELAGTPAIKKNAVAKKHGCCKKTGRIRKEVEKIRTKI